MSALSVDRNNRRIVPDFFGPTGLNFGFNRSCIDGCDDLSDDWHTNKHTHWQTESSPAEAIDWSDARRAFATWGAFMVMVAAFKLVGFLVAFAVLVFFIVAVMYRRRLWVATAAGVGAAAAFYVVFPLALGVKLP